MPEAWSSAYERERAREAKAAKDAGASDRQAEEEAGRSWTTEDEQPRGRRVAD